MPEQRDDRKFAQGAESYWSNIKPFVYILILMGGLLSILQSCGAVKKPCNSTEMHSSRESQ